MDPRSPYQNVPPAVLFALTAVGKIRAIVLPENKQGSVTTGEFLGTAVAYQSPLVFLTSAHAVKGHVPHMLGVSGAFKAETSFCFVREVRVHPKADLAVLLMYDGQHCDPTPAYGIYPLSYAGQEFSAFGYPDEVVGGSANTPVARFFKGHVQRFVDHESHLGYRYRGAELSIPAPAGLSGGPVFTITGPEPRLVGIVTENIQTYTFLDAEEIVEESGNRIHREYRHVVNFGVCLLLKELKDWIDSQIAATAEPA